jgi:hypothetical protein
LLIIYADHVESPLARRGSMPKIVACYCHQFPPLGAIDGCFRGLDIV